MLDCLATHRLDKDQATNAAMGKTQYYLPLDKLRQMDIEVYHRLTTKRQMSYETYTQMDGKDLHQFNFVWAIAIFVISGILILSMKYVWRKLESNRLTYLTSNVRGKRIEEEKCAQMAKEMVEYAMQCETGSYYFLKSLIANILMLIVLVSILAFYLHSIDFFYHPFTIQEFFKWTSQDAEERTDRLYKIFPKQMVFPHSMTGPSGTKEFIPITCTSGLNKTLEIAFVISVLILPCLIVLQIATILASLIYVAIFDNTKLVTKKVVRNLRYLSSGQKYLFILAKKNIDLNLWFEILKVLDTNSYRRPGNNQSTNSGEKKQKKIDPLLATCIPMVGIEQTAEEKEGDILKKTCTVDVETLVGLISKGIELERNRSNSKHTVDVHTPTTSSGEETNEGVQLERNRRNNRHTVIADVYTPPSSSGEETNEDDSDFDKNGQPEEERKKIKRVSVKQNFKQTNFY